MSESLNGSNAALSAYLSDRQEASNALSKLLRNPDGREGITFTPREILQQPFLWRETARMMQARAGELRAFLTEAGAFDADDRPTIVLTGAGTSDYVGLSVSGLLREKFRTPALTWATTRITADPGSYFSGDQRCLMVHFARSGNSPESIAVLDIALEHHSDRIRHLIITCNADGELAKRAAAHPDRTFLILLDDASNDRGLAMTGSFSNMVIAAQSLAHLDDMDAFVGLMDRMAGAAEQFIHTYADQIHDLADAEAISRVFFLGNGDLFGAAAESALKIQELTAGKVIAKHEDTLAFRHGPVSAVNENTLVTFFLSADAYTRQYELDVLNQYRDAFNTLGARILVLTASASDVAQAEGITLLTYDPEGSYEIPRHHQVDLAALLGQMLGLFASYRMGLNVDDPTANSGLYARTVQGVQLYAYTPEPTGLLTDNK